MTNISSLNQIHKLGKFGDHENKSEENLLRISEVSNICIFQIVKLQIEHLKKMIGKQEITLDATDDSGIDWSAGVNDSGMVLQDAGGGSGSPSQLQPLPAR